MDKVKFFAIVIPVLIGLTFLFRILIPVTIAAVAICIITMVLFGKKNDNGFLRKFQSRELTKFVCIECGYYHNENACPKCGSKIKKYYSKT